LYEKWAAGIERAQCEDSVVIISAQSEKILIPAQKNKVCTVNDVDFTTLDGMYTCMRFFVFKWFGQRNPSDLLINHLKYIRF
jgi:hypothetical protein